MKKIIIIGSSIAGASAAFFLAPYADIVVYEKKSKKDIGNKVCANVVTSLFLKYAKQLNINPKEVIVSEFNKAIGFSENNKVVFKTKEFRINRCKFIEQVIKNAQKKGVKFVFNAEFIDYAKKREGFIVKLKRGNKTITENSDILVGADGALSNVAKKAGLWENRRLFLVMHTEIPLNSFKKFRIDKKAYYIFFGRKKGYYGYIFPYKNKIVIGAGDRVEALKSRYKDFLKFMGVKSREAHGALVPEPKVIPQKENLFLIGDAGCHIKFSGGGIIPSMMAAEAIKEIIINNNYKKLKELNRRTVINKIAARLIENLNDRDFNKLLEILKDKKFSDVVSKRDKFGKKEYFAALDFRILKLLIKLI